MRAALLFSILLLGACKSTSSSSPVPLPEPKTGETPPTEEEKERLRREAILEEAIKRIKKEPIVLGQGAGGIDIDTINPMEALGLKGFDDFVTSSAGLHITMRGHFIERILISDKYEGSLRLPAPYGEIRIGQNFEEFIKEKSAIEAFANALSKELEGETASDYDCLKVKSCEIGDSNGGPVLRFPRARLFFNAKFELTSVIVHRFFDYYDFHHHIIYGRSAGGISFKTAVKGIDKEFKTVVHAVDASGKIESTVTNGTVAYWGENGLPKKIMDMDTPTEGANLKRLAVPNFKTLLLGMTIPPQQLESYMKNIFNGVENKAADFDCKAASPALCSLQTITDPDAGQYYLMKLPLAELTFTLQGKWNTITLFPRA